MGHYYISFATDEGHRGSTVVKAHDPLHAVVVATELGLNPGGEAAVLYIPPGAEQSEPDLRSMINRLVTAEELLAQGAKKLGDLPQYMQDRFEQAADVVCAGCNENPKA